MAIASDVSVGGGGHRSAFRIAGKGVPVKDAKEKVTGSLKYAVDMEVQGMVHGKILRSPHPHARIVRIDTSRAEALPGVVGTVTHLDAPPHVWENAWFNYRGKVLDGIARFHGDDVAAVAAMREDIAEAALELIDVEYELLPTVFDPEEAMKPDAPQIREEGNVRDPYVVEWGDVEKGEQEADFTVDCEIRFASQQMAPLGRNACIAEWSGDRITLWTSSQTPSELRDGIHEAFGIPLSRVRVFALPSGSSFGNWWSANFMLITALLARKVRKPVKIELTNEECMATVKRRHIEISRGRMGCTNDGTLTLAKFDHIIDNGGYGFKDDVGFFCVDNWGRAHHGHYAIHGVNTNLLTAGCMRAVGDVTLGACVERVADMCAIKVDMDPVEFRLKNQVKTGERLRMQHSRQYMRGSLEEYLEGIPEEQRKEWPKLFHLSSGSTDEILRKGAEAFAWKEKWKGWGVPYAVDGPRRRAVGVGTGAHVCGVEFEGNVSAVVRINPDGSAKVHCAVGRQGQGSETTQVQVAAEELGIPFDKVEIETGGHRLLSLESRVSGEQFDVSGGLGDPGRGEGCQATIARDRRPGVLRCVARRARRDGRSHLFKGPPQEKHPHHDRGGPEPFSQRRRVGSGVFDHRPSRGTDATSEHFRETFRRALRRRGSRHGDRGVEIARFPGDSGQRDDHEPAGDEEPDDWGRHLRSGLRHLRSVGVRGRQRSHQEREPAGLQAVAGGRFPVAWRGDLRGFIRSGGALRGAQRGGGSRRCGGTGDCTGGLQRDRDLGGHADDPGERGRGAGSSVMRAWLPAAAGTLGRCRGVRSPG